MNKIKEALRNIKLKIKNNKESSDPKIIDWTVFLLVAIFIYTCFIYWDIFVTTSHTVNYIESISAGKIFDLYKVNYKYVVDGLNTTVSYDIPIYFAFMIWDFPLWIARHFFNVDIMSNFLCMLYMKGISALFLYFSAKVFKKICEEIKIKKEYIKWAVLVFVSSPFVFSSLFIMSQYDIIPIFFILLGILAYVKGDENKFLLWFAIAAPMKLFAIFIFIPLLLLKEKGILQIFRKFLVSVSILVLFRVIAQMMPYYTLSTNAFTEYMVDKLLSSSVLKINSGGASLFIVVYVIICVFCYMKSLKSKEESYKYSVYIPFAVFSSFLAFVNFHPQWLIYLTPFFTLVLFKNSKYFKVNLLIDIAFEFVGLFIITYYFTACFGAKEVRGMLISKIFGVRNISDMSFKTIGMIYNRFNLHQFLPAFYGVFLAALICLVVINFPKLNDKAQKIQIERSAILIRMLEIVPFGILLITCYLS